MALPTETAEDAEMKAIRKSGRHESRNSETGSRRTCSEALQVGRPRLWAPLLQRAEDCPPYLLVRDRSAGWAGKMDDFEAFEADFAAPFFEIGGGIIGVTSDERTEKKLLACAFLRVESVEGECELARKKCEANPPDGAINSGQLLSMGFLRSAFSE